MKQKGLTTVLIILSATVFVIILSYFFLTSPHEVGGQPILLFKNGEFLLSERITYLFRSAQVGDRVIFFPTTKGIDHLGIIIDVLEVGDVKTYKIVSGEKGTTWSVSPEKITGRIYYPFVSKEEIDSTISNLPSDWKTYTSVDRKYSFKYPPDYSLQQYNSQRVIIRNKETNDLINHTENTVPNANNYVNLFIDVQDNNEGLTTDTFINNQYIQSLVPKAQQGDPYAKGSLEKLRNSLKDYKNGNISGKYMLLGGETFSPTVIQVFQDSIYIFTNQPDQTGSITTDLSNKIFDQILSTFKFLDQKL